MLADSTQAKLLQGSALLTLFLGLIIFPIFFLFLINCELTDFEVYLQAATAYAQGTDIYDSAYSMMLRGTPVSLKYLYPPFLAWFLSLFLSFGRESIRYFWILTSLLSLLIAIFALCHLHWPTRDWRKVRNLGVLCMCIALWPPVFDGLMWGQVNTLILAPLAIAYVCLVRGRFWIAGLALGLIIAVKGTPLWLLIPCVFFRQWNTIFIALVSAALLNIPACFGAQGISIFTNFFSTGSELARGKIIIDPYYDYSFDQVFLTFVPQKIAYYLALLLRGWIAIWFMHNCYRLAWRGKQYFGAAFLQGIPVMIATAPIVWFHHFTWAIIALVEIFLLCDQEKGKFQKAFIGFLYVALGLLLYVHVMARHNFGSGELLVKMALPVFLLTLAATIPRIVDGRNLLKISD